MSHKCAQEGCGFHLPDSYPLPLCPWHLAPDADRKTKAVAVAAGLGTLAVGYGVSKAVEVRKQLKRREEIREGQEQWRKRKRSAPDSKADTDDTTSDSRSDIG